MTQTSNFNMGLRSLAIAAICAGLGANAFAAELQGPATTVKRAPSIALHEGGVLYGQVVDAKNKPVANQQVRILSQGRLVIATKSNAEGRFGAQKMRGGIHTIELGGTSQSVRLWAPTTAPPSADQAVVIVAGEGPVVRGQEDDTNQRRRRLILLGLAGAGLAWALDNNPSGS